MMLEQETLDELFLEAGNQVLAGHQTPSRDGHSTETLGFVGRLTDPKANFMFNPVRKMSPSYAAAELLWYLSGNDDIYMIKAYAPQYERFAENGRAYGAYGARWYESEFHEEFFNLVHTGKLDYPQNKFFKYHDGIVVDFDCPINQLQAVAWLLHKKQDSRQAIVTMWSSRDLPHAIAGDKKDMPCTLALNFIVRENKLYLTATMRSNDIWLGLPYDVWAFTCIQQLLANALQLELGWYQHQAMSLHVYDRNEEQLTNAVYSKFSTDTLSYNELGRVRLREQVNHTMTLEKHNRAHKVSLKLEQEFRGTLLGQCVVMAASKWIDSSDQIENKIMKEYMKCLL